jgi:hypothetical protein
MEANPELAKGIEYLNSAFGIDTAKTMADNEIRDIKAQVGHTNPTKAAENINTDAEIRDKTRQSSKIDAKAFASHKVDTIAYFRNPTNATERLAADGTTIGGRDKRTWNQRLKDENAKEFINTLKRADGNFIKFESDYHRLLFHFANRPAMKSALTPEVYKAFDDKLFREIQKHHPNMTRTGAQHEADRLMNHLQLLAQSGTLTKKQNIFKSTLTKGADFTKWQGDLHTEVEEQEMKFLTRTIKQHPHSLKAMQGIVEIFQTARRVSMGVPNEWETMNKVIQNLISGSIS